MEYEIKVNISKEDHFAFQKEYFMNSKITIIFLSICLAWSFFSIGQDIYNDRRDIVSLILKDAIPVILMLLGFVLLFPPIYRCLLKHLYNSDRAIQEEQTLLLKEDGIHQSMQRGSFNYTLEDFKRVIFGKKIIAIFVSKQKALLLPRHCFSSKEEEQAVEDFIKTHYVKAKKEK